MTPTPEPQAQNDAPFSLVGLGRLLDWLVDANDRLDAEEAAALVAREEVAS